MKKGIYTLPNLFTFTNMLCGFLSLACVVKDKYNFAALLILLGMVFDFLDGYLSWRLDKESEFGKRLDSFADLITFGIAPVILIFAASFKSYGFVYKFSLLIYFIAISYRLIRYSLKSNNNIFQGLPATFSGGFIAFIFLCFPSFFTKPWSFLFFVMLAFLSISSIPYKKIVVKKNSTALLILLILIILYLVFKEYLILSLFVLYLLSGFVNVFYLRKKSIRR
ncbi:CDP-alcohol phosphatidyltransferase family protein [bacterium]|nr:CDP-alcohol phosphatidyltransferase family protein [bacterium]MCG2676075.1 CDP-alcohol phosphatidyltransferase family protein [bacterium]